MTTTIERPATEVEDLIAPEPYVLSTAAAKFHTEINRDWRKVQPRRQKLHAAQAALADVDPMVYGAEHAEQAAKNRLEEIALLQTEIGIRRRALSWPATVAKERLAAADRAESEANRIVDDVREKMKSIGFIDPREILADGDPRLFGWLRFLNMHPAIEEAASTAQSLRSLVNSGPHTPDQTESIQRAENRLRELVAHQ